MVSEWCSSLSSGLLGNSVTLPPHSLISQFAPAQKFSANRHGKMQSAPTSHLHSPIRVSGIRATLCDRGQCERVSGAGHSAQCCQLQPWTSGGSVARPLQHGSSPTTSQTLKKTTQFPAFSPKYFLEEWHLASFTVGNKWKDNIQHNRTDFPCPKSW